MQLQATDSQFVRTRVSGMMLGTIREREGEPVHILLIANPAARNGRAREFLQPVVAAFAEQGITVTVEHTTCRGDAIERVQHADLDGVDALVAMGGDGTVFETVNGLFRRKKGRKLPLGIIPVGTGNAFVRDFGLDTAHWKDAVRCIVNGRTKAVDVGQFVCKDGTWQFLNIVGLGFVSDVCETAHKLKKIGNLSYTIGVFHRTIKLDSFPMRLVVDGEEQIRETVFIEVSNSRYTSNFLMAPEARLDDGYLDVTVLNKVTRRKLLSAFPRIFKGTHVELPEVDSFQVKHLVIETDRPRLLTPDGELLGNSPVTIECLHKALNVFVP